MRNNKHIQGEIKYLALGDSYSAGISLENSKSESGFSFVENDKLKIEGNALPAFLAKLFQKFSNSKISWFKNYSFAESSANTWLYLLNINQNEKNKINYEKVLAFEDQSHLNANKETKKIFLEKITNQKIENSYVFYNLNQAIAKSNLITLTVGFKEILNSIPVEWIFMTSTNKKCDIVKFKEVKNEFWTKLVSTTIIKYVEIIKKIKTINPKTKIIIIGVNNLFERINSVIDKQLLEISNSELIKTINDSFASIPLLIVKRFRNVHFINSYNKKQWAKQEYYYSNFFISPLPNYLGLKQLAKELFLKLNFSSKDLQKIFKQKEFYPKINLKNFIVPQKFDLQLSNKIQEYSLIEENKYLPDKMNLRNISLRWSGTNNDLFLKCWISLLNSLKEYSPHAYHSLYEFLIIKKHYIEITRIIFASSIFQSFIDSIQHELDNKEQNNDAGRGIKNLIWYDLILIFRQNINIKEFIIRGLNEIYGSFYFSNKEKNLMLHVNDILINLLSDKVFIRRMSNNLIQNYLVTNEQISFEVFEHFYDNLLKRKKINEYVKKLTNILLNHSDTYENPSSAKEYLGLFLTNQFKEIINLIFSLIENIIEDKETYLDIIDIVYNVFPKEKFAIQDFNFISDFWKIAFKDKDQSAKAFIFGLSEFYSLKFSFSEQKIFEKSEDEASFVTTMTKNLLQYTYKTLKQLSYLSDYSLILYWIFSLKIIRKLILSTSDEKYAIKSVKIISILKIIPLVRKNLKIITSSLFIYYKENQLLDEYKEVISMLLNLSLEVTNSINYKNINSTKSRFVKWLFFKWIKSKDPQENKVNKNLAKKYENTIVLQDEIHTIQKNEN